MNKNYNTKQKRAKVGLSSTIKTIATCFAVFLVNAVTAQDIDYAWAKNLGGGSNDIGKSIVADSDGNVYTAGSYAGTADFDPGTGTNEITPNGAFDIFVSKLDASGNFLWAKSIGGTGFDHAYSIFVDGSGNVYITGYFNGTVDFDPGTGTSNLTSNGGNDIFVTKLDAAGNFLWAKNFGSTGQDEGNSIQVDNSGNVYTSGTYSGTVDFNPGSATSNLVSISGGDDIFVSKLNASGNFVWAKSFGATYGDRGLAMKLDASGNVFTAGAFRGTGDFDPGSGTTTLTSVNGAQDIFISKLSSSGNLVWAKSCGGTADDVSFSIDVDDAGNVYFAGEFSGTADFNPGTATNSLNSFGGSDAFITKLDASGNFVWTRQLGGTDYEKASGISVDRIGNIYITGEYRGTIDLDPGKGNSSFTSKGNSDIFIVKLNPSGFYLWATSYGWTLEDKGASIFIDNSGNLYSTGHFMVSIDFDPGPGTSWVSSKGYMDAYIVKYGCTPTSSTHKVSACKNYVFNGVNYTSSNNTATQTFINSVGCDSIITLDLTINSIDVSTTLKGDTIIANITGATYQWINCSKGNTLITGATKADYTPNVDGDYAVIVTFKGCTDTSDCVNINTVGINDIGLANTVYQLYPNPATSEVTISNFSKSIDNISILDVTGKVLRSFVPESGIIDISMLQNGIYFVTIQNGSSNSTRKIIKK